MYKYWSDLFSEDIDSFIEAVKFSDRGNKKKKNTLHLLQDYKEIISKRDIKERLEKDSARSRTKSTYVNASSEEKYRMNAQYESRILDLEEEINMCFDRSNKRIKDILNEYNLHKLNDSTIQGTRYDQISSIISDDELSNLNDMIDQLSESYIKQYVRENPEVGILDEDEQLEQFRSLIHSNIFNEDDTIDETQHLVDDVLDIYNSAVKETKSRNLLKTLNIINKIKD